MRRASVSLACVIGAMRCASLPGLSASPAALPTLSFDWKDGCPPVFSPRQMELHFTKHHKAYVDKFNILVGHSTEFAGKTIEEAIVKLSADASKKVLFNQAAQHFNHTFFWKCITPKGSPMPNSLKSALAAEFGSVEEFQKLFEAAAVNNFGSGWTWLVYNPSTGKLQLDNTSNAGCPIVSGLVPLFTADVWEHCYYKDFENRRGDFVHELWNIADWAFVDSQLTKAKN